MAEEPRQVAPAAVADLARWREKTLKTNAGVLAVAWLALAISSTLAVVEGELEVGLSMLVFTIGSSIWIAVKLARDLRMTRDVVVATHDSTFSWFLDRDLICASDAASPMRRKVAFAVTRRQRAQLTTIPRATALRP